MRRSIFVGVVVTCLVAVGTAVALAQQPSQGSGQLDEGLRSPTEAHSWMTDNWDEPMYGGSGVVGEDGWHQSHDEMHSWMTDNWDEMPMFGGSGSGWMTDNRDERPMFGGSTGEWMSENWDQMPMHGGGSRG